MALVSRRICDLCSTESEVETLTVVYKRSDNRPWELDLCQRCYRSRLGDMADKGRRAKASNVRAPARVKKTVITADDL